jgi:pyruvate dehydrogenase E2 component (dihydrolipoamide acetyltransferase)
MPAATIQVLVPDIGDFDEVEVIEVLVAKGDRVEVEDSLITLESDKATMEIPSPQAGVVAEVTVQLGDQVSEGSMLLTLEVEGENAGAGADEGAGEGEGTSEAVAAAPELPVEEPVAAVAQAPAARDSAARVSAAPGPADRLPGEPPSSSPPVAEERAGGELLPHASPLVRKAARELGVDLSQATGSGPQGRVLVEDVKDHVRQTLTSGAGRDAGSGIPAVRRVDFARYGEIEEVPLPRIRQRAGRNLTTSWLNLPHVTQHDEADITELEGYRKSKADSAREQGVRLSPLVFIMKAVVLALRRFPEFASSLSPDGTALILKKSFHLGIAVDTENGLVVPVVRDVHRKRLVELARETAELAESARDGKLSPEQMSGACFTISSLGGIGGSFFTPIVNAPEVALLGVSRTVVKPVWSKGLDVSAEGGGHFEPRLMLPLSLSYDHRVIDGAAAVRFTTYLRSTLEEPAHLLL